MPYQGHGSGVTYYRYLGTYLIQTHKQPQHIPLKKTWFQSFLPTYNYTYAYWNNWLIVFNISLTEILTQGNSEVILFACLEFFSNPTTKWRSSKIWCHILRLIRQIHTLIRAAFFIILSVKVLDLFHKLITIVLSSECRFWMNKGPSQVSIMTCRQSVTQL